MISNEGLMREEVSARKFAMDALKVFLDQMSQKSNPHSTALS
jgi:hypothetical protein